MFSYLCKVQYVSSIRAYSQPVSNFCKFGSFSWCPLLVMSHIKKGKLWMKTELSHSHVWTSTTHASYHAHHTTISVMATFTTTGTALFQPDSKANMFVFCMLEMSPMSSRSEDCTTGLFSFFVHSFKCFVGSDMFPPHYSHQHLPHFWAPHLNRMWGHQEEP